ncbi:PREDICTED: PHD finger protein 7-like [Diuraphis noxia]|uniref:PHD finger protein 7-like n=1 Tax=Diuraphis noxia TaxID=143948 RepID=UPI00076364AB|nr:PREDICTED: PHD finger protein 7-like [Diuraphis noxia]
MAPTTRRGTKLAYNKKVELIDGEKACMLCGHKETSEILYGKLYQLNDVIVHNFCLVLSPRAFKNGTDEEGIHGFLSNDIKDELTRGSRETCVYCKKKGATISCFDVNCQKVFHLPCGLSKGSMHQYFGTFKSFCKQHRILPVIPALATIECRICNDSIIQSTLSNSIWAPCCKPNNCFHRECVQDLVLRKGYFIECPICKNIEIFKYSILTLGIYIPSRYSTLRRGIVPNGIEELVNRKIKCNAENCLCPYSNGEKYQDE